MQLHRSVNVELSLPAAKVLGTFALGSESYKERKFHSMDRSESSCYLTMYPEASSVTAPQLRHNELSHMHQAHRHSV